MKNKLEAFIDKNNGPLMPTSAAESLSGSVTMRDRLRKILTPGKMDMLQNLLFEMGSVESINRDMIKKIDALYSDISSAKSVIGDENLGHMDVADCFITTIVSYLTDVQPIQFLSNLIHYTNIVHLSLCAESRLHELIFDHRIPIPVDKLAFPTMLLAILLRPNSIFTSLALSNCDVRIDVGYTLCKTILSQEDLTSTTIANDIYSYIVNTKFDNRHLKELMNKDNWDRITLQLLNYTGPYTKLSRFIENLVKICKFLEMKGESPFSVTYLNLLTKIFINPRFQIDLLLLTVDEYRSELFLAIDGSPNIDKFTKLTPNAKRSDLLPILWIIDTDILLVLMSLSYNTTYANKVWSWLSNLVRDSTNTLVREAFIYKLSLIWYNDQNTKTENYNHIQLRLATMNKLFWSLYEACLDKFVDRKKLTSEIKELIGESFKDKDCEALYDFILRIAANMPDDCFLLILLEIIRISDYDLDVMSFTLQINKSKLLQCFKSNSLKLSRGMLEIICYCRQTFDWGFMTMLIRSIDILIGSHSDTFAKKALASGFMDYLHWKLLQTKPSPNNHHPDVKVYIPECNIIAEIFYILHHIMGANEELIYLFFMYNAQYKTLYHYNILLLPLFKTIDNKLEPMDSFSVEGNIEDEPAEMNDTVLDLSDKVEYGIGMSRDIYGYLLLNEDVEETTTHIMDLIFAGEMHANILNAIKLLNNDSEGLRSQYILDLVLRKFVNKLYQILNLAMPSDFCLHNPEKISGILKSLGIFCGSIISLHLSGAHVDSVYLIFRILLEALKRDDVFIVEFAIVAFHSIRNVRDYPEFAKEFVGNRRMQHFYPKLFSDMERRLNSDISEISVKTDTTELVEDIEEHLVCLRGKIDNDKFDGLTILKQQTSPLIEGVIEPTASDSASMFFSIISLASTVTYKQFKLDLLWHQEQLALNNLNATFDDFFNMLKVDMSVPEKSLESLNIMDVSFGNKRFINHIEHLVTTGYIEWLLFIMFRYAILRGESQFRDCIVFITTLGGNRMINEMVKFSTYSVNIFFKYLKSCRGSITYRKLLKLCGSWLGAITLGRNKPLLSKHLDLKHLIIYAYENGLLTCVIPFVCKFLDYVKSSKLFRLPNPWTTSLFALLNEIANIKGLKTLLASEINAIFRNAEFTPGKKPPTELLKHYTVAEADQTPKFSSTVWCNSPSESKIKIPSMDQEIGLLMKKKIVINPKLLNLQLKLSWHDTILSAIEVCYSDSISIIEKTITTCMISCNELIKIDFPPDTPVDIIKRCVTSLSSGLASNLVLVNSRDVLTSTLYSEILDSLNSFVNDPEAPLNNDGLPELLNIGIESAAQVLTKDNVGLVYALVEQLTIELMTRCLEDNITSWRDNNSVEKRLPELLQVHALDINSRVNIYKKFAYLVPSAANRIQSEPGSAEKRVVGLRLPDYFIVPPIDNLPTQLILCKFDEFDTRLKDSAKYLMIYPPTVPLINSKFLYTAETPSLLLLSCLPKDHLLFSLLWNMHYLCLKAANLPECFELIVNKVVKSIVESSKGVCVSSIVSEMELCLMEMLVADSPNLLNITTQLLPNLTFGKLALFLRFRLIRMSALDQFLCNSVDVEFVAKILYRLIIECSYVSASDLPQSIQYLNKCDKSMIIQSIGIPIELRKLYDRVVNYKCETVEKLRTLRYYTMDKGYIRNKSIIQFNELINKKYITIFSEYLSLKTDRERELFYLNFNEQPIDGFITCTLLCTLQMSYEPIGTELRCDKLPQVIHEVPNYDYCNSWTQMILGFVHNDVFILQKTLHLLLNLLTLNICLPLFSKIIENMLMCVETNNSFVSIGHFLLLSSPSDFSEFGQYWLNLVANKTFVQHIIISPVDWPLYHQLLQQAIIYTQANSQLITLILLILIQNAPEFVCGYYLSLCDILPSKAIKIRNLITCSTPRNVKVINPVIFDENIDVPPMVYTNHIQTILRRPTLKSILDLYINEPNPKYIPFISKELFDNFDPLLLNHFTLYIGYTLPTLLSKISSNTISTQNITNCYDLLEKLIMSSKGHIKHVILGSVMLHIRYPNNTTMKFVSFLKNIFEYGESSMQEHVMLTLLERLLIPKPYPWGIIYLMFQFVKSDKAKFWEYIQNNAQVEQHVKGIIQAYLGGCGGNSKNELV